MYFYFVAKLRSAGPYTPEEKHAFQDADITFKGAIISMLGDSIVDAYVTFPTKKEIWDALETKYGVFYAASELYVMKQFYDYTMADGCSVVEQANTSERT